MKITRPDLAAYALVALCVVGIVVLTALRAPVPDFLSYAATTALGIGGGVAYQGAQNNAAAPAADPAPAQLARPAIPAPAAPYDPAATGVFRAATHAP